MLPSHMLPLPSHMLPGHAAHIPTATARHVTALTTHATAIPHSYIPFSGGRAVFHFSWSSIRASTAPSVGEFAAGARARAAAAEFAARRSAKRLEKFMMARRRRQQQQDLQQLLPTAATKGYQVGDTKVDSTNARDMVPYNYISHIYETLNGSHIII